MKIEVFQEGECTVVEIAGYLDFSSTTPLKETFDTIYRRNNNARIAIDLQRLEFVGSSGVSTFVKTLRQYNTLRMKPSYFGVKSEFVKLFRAFEEDKPFEVLDNKQIAVATSIQRFHLLQTVPPIG